MSPSFEINDYASQLRRFILSRSVYLSSRLLLVLLLFGLLPKAAEAGKSRTQEPKKIAAKAKVPRDSANEKKPVEENQGPDETITFEKPKLEKLEAQLRLLKSKNKYLTSQNEAIKASGKHDINIIIIAVFILLLALYFGLKRVITKEARNLMIHHKRTRALIREGFSKFDPECKELLNRPSIDIPTGARESAKKVSIDADPEIQTPKLQDKEQRVAGDAVIPPIPKK